MELNHIQEEILQELAFKPASEWTEAERLHLKTCPDCRESLEAYQLVFAELGDQPDPVFSASFEADILDRIPELNPQAVPLSVPVASVVSDDEESERTPWWQWGGIAAGIAAVSAVTLYAFFPAGQSPALDSFSEKLGRIGTQFSEIFSFMEGNEVLILGGLVSFASIFFVDRLLSRRHSKDFIPE